MKKQPSTTEIILSLTTVPCLLTIVGMQGLLKLVETMGVNSEEVFRGKRLPVLRNEKFPEN